MDTQTIRCEVQDYIALVTMDRPPVNAVNAQFLDDMMLVFDTLSDRDDVRVAILTGAGRTFCAGADIKERAGREREPGDIWQHSRKAREAFHSLVECKVPVIAAINGAAIGWGFELALFADLRIASDRARFSEMFVKRGLSCDVGGFYRLPALVGPEKAAELLFTGDVIDAAEALRIGLVGRVVAHADLLREAQALAGRIAANPPLAVRALKAGLRRSCYGDPREIGGWAIDTIRRLAHTDDHREGVASFLEKRAAVFHGR